MLASGVLVGKIICPNEKCGAKIGSFDWAGVQCGCKEWVTPVRFLCCLTGRLADFLYVGVLHSSKQGR